MHRRTYLRGVAVGAGAVTAGCSLAPRPDTTPTPEPEQRALDAVRLSHGASDPKRVSLLLTRDEEVVYWQTLELPAAEGHRQQESLVVAPPDYEQAPGSHHVYVRNLTDGVRNDLALAEWFQSQPCYVLVVDVAADGIGFAQSLNDPHC